MGLAKAPGAGRAAVMIPRKLCIHPSLATTMPDVWCFFIQLMCFVPAAAPVHVHGLVVVPWLVQGTCAAALLLYTINVWPPQGWYPVVFVCSRQRRYWRAHDHTLLFASSDGPSKCCGCLSVGSRVSHTITQWCCAGFLEWRLHQEVESGVC